MCNARPHTKFPTLPSKRRDGAMSAEREELSRLRRENHRLRQERGILAKAAAWFALESKVTPSGSAGS
jgi:transposase